MRTNRSQLDEEAIFNIARKLTDANDRSEYLEQVCAGEHALRQRVEELLKVHHEEQSFLKSNDQRVAATVDLSPSTERPGATIGRYKLMEQIGEGGMGTVFVAQQDRPIRRKVALKVIKPGMDTMAVVARFEAERQALAMMDHPNIAKVLDAGTTESGRPYFAMELVKGVPITDYCDRNRLSIKERLELFIQVCHAIQHAHQKGIIHRDIKPSNVLVTLHDGKPVPKVIDFGVAKALNARLTDKTIYTEHLQIVGTLLYMSPEQAELSGLNVDTRSDIYSLGVLLYELLTGTTPFQKDELDKAGFDEQRRIIRDKEPPRASVRISSLGETATAVAEHRKTDPKKLHQAVHGDLDWIALKSLEKDRTRRYDSPTRLAEDIRSFLDGNAVEACPPTLHYRAVKYVKRNRIAIGVVGLVIATLSIGLAGTLVERSKTYAALAELQELAITEGFDAALAGNVKRARQLAEAAHSAGAEPDTVAAIKALSHVFSGEPETAIDSIAVRNGYEQSVALCSALALAYMWKGDITESRSTRRILKGLPVQDDYGRCLKAIALLNEWDSDYARSQTLVDIVKKNGDWLMARFFYASHLRKLAQDSGDLQIAVEAIDEAKIVSSTLGDTKLGRVIPVLCYHVAYTLAREKTDPRAEQWKQACERSIEVLSPDQLQMAAWHFDDTGQLDEAIRYWKEWSSANDQHAAVRRCGYISCLLRAGEHGQAVEALKHDPQNDDWSLLNQSMTIVDQMTLTESDSDLTLKCDQLLKADKIQPQARSMLLTLLILNGAPESDVAEIASRWHRDDELESAQFEKAVWKFYSQPHLIEQTLVESANDSRCNQARAKFYAAIRHLSLGQLEDAESYLQECSDANAFQYIETPWARILLHKLRRDGEEMRP